MFSTTLLLVVEITFHVLSIQNIFLKKTLTSSLDIKSQTYLIFKVSVQNEKKKVLVTHLCLTLCDPMDCSPSVYGILQPRTLELVATPFSRGSPDPGIEPGSPALEADSLPSEPHRILQSSVIIYFGLILYAILHHFVAALLSFCG